MEGGRKLKSCDSDSGSHALFSLLSIILPSGVITNKISGPRPLWKSQRLTQEFLSCPALTPKGSRNDAGAVTGARPRWAWREWER